LNSIIKTKLSKSTEKQVDLTKIYFKRSIFEKKKSTNSNYNKYKTVNLK